MPSWGLAPAERLEAKYDSPSKRLVLIAEGFVGNYSSGMAFDRVPVPNGLLFQLGDWHMVGGPRVAYRHIQSFALELPNRMFPSNRITIETLSGFRALQISGLPIVTDSTEEKGAQTTTLTKTHLAKNDARMIKTTPIKQDLIIVHKEHFTITTTTFVKGHPSALLDISFKFDPNFFDLHTTTAQYIPTTKSTTLTYTFTSIQTGTSQILIHRLIQTLTPQLETTTYNIDIDLPSHPTFIPSSKLSKLLHSRQEQKPLTFLERVLMGYQVVRRAYPNAQLLEVDASAVRPGMAVDTPMGFVLLRLTLSPCDATDRTVTVSSTGWNDWEEAVTHDFVTWDLMPIPIPAEVGSGEMEVGEQIDVYFSGLRVGDGEEGGSEDVCGGCGGNGGHSPSCLDGDGKVGSLKTGDKGSGEVQSSPVPISTSTRTTGSKRERSKTTAHNFTTTSYQKQSKPKPNPNPNPNPKSSKPQLQECPFLDILTAFQILTTFTSPPSSSKSTTKISTNAPKLSLISCNLRYPMYPGFNEPYYVFTLQEPIAGMGSLYVGIGAVDGGIRVFGGGQGGAVRRLSDAGAGTLALGVEGGGVGVGGGERMGGEWGRGEVVGAY